MDPATIRVALAFPGIDPVPSSVRRSNASVHRQRSNAPARNVNPLAILVHKAGWQPWPMVAILGDFLVAAPLAFGLSYLIGKPPALAWSIGVKETRPRASAAAVTAPEHNPQPGGGPVADRWRTGGLKTMQGGTMLVARSYSFFTVVLRSGVM